MGNSEFFTAEIIIGLIGIEFTGVIAFLIFWIQRRADENINKIIRQQSKIIKSNQLRRNRRIKWMSDHLVSLLGSLRKNYSDLLDRVDEYHENKSQENVRRLALRAYSII